MAALIPNSADKRQIAMAVTGPFVLIAPFFVSLSLTAEAALWLAVWCCICRHNYVLHNHVHHPFTSSKWLNRILGAMLGFCTGMTVGNWKITHVHGHHVEHKAEHLRSRTYIKYLRIDDQTSFSPTAGLKHALRTAPLQWLLPLHVMLVGLYSRSKARRKFSRYYLAEFLVVYGTVGALFWINPCKGFAYFGVMYALVYLISRYVDYITHIGSHGTSSYSFANVCLHPGYNKAFWNFGFHVAHHLRPSTHWTQLPSLHRTLPIEEEPRPIVIRPTSIGFFSAQNFWHRIRDVEDYEWNK